MAGIAAAFIMILMAGLAPGLPPFEEIPKVDVHAHYFDDMPEFAAMLERANMKAVIVCVFKNRPQMLEPLQERAAMLSKKYAPQLHFASTFDVSRPDDPNFAANAAAWLDRSYEAGAVMTKIWKEVGMAARRENGDYLLPDSEILDPVYAHIEKRGKPLLAHFADPIEAWQPPDAGGVHSKYYAENPEWRMHGRAGVPSHAEISAACERMLAKHPKLAVIGAHLGSLEHDLDALGRRLDQFPNYSIDVSARAPDLRRYPPERVRAFFIKYQDRILYGLDQGKYTPGPGPSAEERERYSTEIEKWYRKDYAYYAGEELALPREALEKFYHGNAERLLGGLK